jgi:HD-GYP domain-containing protein (c-di-GMP phosphodiesterase class II)
VTGLGRPTSGGVPAVAGDAEAGDQQALRRAGRIFIGHLHAALRAVKLYPVENAAVQKAVADVLQSANEVLRLEGELELRASGEFLFVSGARVRLDLDNYAAFAQVLGVFRANGIGALRIEASPTPRDLIVLLSQLQAPAAPGADPAARRDEVADRLEQAGIRLFELVPPTETADEAQAREKSREASKRTYAQSVAVSKEVVNSVRIGKSPNIKRIKRVVQTLVDQVLSDDTSLLGLTTLRDYDEYTFVHSVNVCIFSVALGRRLGLTRPQLYDLGLAALLHDIGKARVPIEVLNKTGSLTDDEWRLITAHPWLGVLALMQMRGAQELPYRAMTVAFEHHMKADLTGYPRPVRPRELSIFSKIVAVADGFDAATSQRVYQQVPLQPSDVLREMRDNPRRGMDPVIVKAFVALLGIYPVGTLLRLDTFELAVVHAANPDPEAVSRPIVRIISDAQGNVVFPGELVDMAERDEHGQFRRTAIKTENPDRYGIRVSDYFV